MSFYEFPHTRTYDSDLGWLIRRVIEIKKELGEFINLNTIKYADPIGWNITRQYETNTVVINPADGTAYISTQPVPSGVLITNPDYWTPIFNYGESIAELRQQLVYSVEEGLVSANDYHKGDLLWWYNTLYIVIRDIATGEPLTVNYNLSEITLQDWVVSLTNNLHDLIVSLTYNRQIVCETTREMLTTDLKTGDVVRTQGFYTAGDGGEALFTIVNDVTGAGTEYLSETGKIALENGLAAVLLPSGTVCANAFGVSSTLADNSVPFNDAVQYCIDTYNTLNVKTGTYEMGSPLYVRMNKDYTGGNRFMLFGNLSTLRFASEDGVIVFNDQPYDPSRYKYFANVTIRDLSLTRASAGTSGCGLQIGTLDNKIDSFKFILIENVIIQQFFYGYGIANARHINFKDCTARTVPYGIMFGCYADIGTETHTMFSGDCVFESCEFSAQRGIRFVTNSSNQSMQSFAGVTFSHTYFYGGVAGQNYISAAGNNYRVLDWIFDSCRFDQLHAIALNLQGFAAAGSLKQDIILDSCVFIGIDTAVKAYSTKDVLINNCQFQSFSGAPIITGGCENIDISNNIFCDCKKMEISGTGIVVSSNAIRETNDTYCAKFAGCTRIAVTGNTFDLNPPLELGSLAAYNISGNASPGVAVNQYA